MNHNFNVGMSSPGGGGSGDQTDRSVKVTLVGAQTIANATVTKINWDSEVFDTDAFHDNVTNNSRLTVPAGMGGKYIITFNTDWVLNNVGERFLDIIHNNTTVIGASRKNAINDTEDSVVTTHNLAAGDYVEARVNQLSGGNLNFQVTSQFSMHKIVGLAPSSTDFWTEAGRTILTVAGDTIDVSVADLKKFVKIDFYVKGTGSVTAALRFNSDTGTNYARGLVRNGGAVFLQTAQTSLYLAANTDIFGVLEGRNIQANNKLFTNILSEAANSSAAPSVSHSSFKWVNTADLITSVQLINTAANDFGIGSEMVISHHD